MSLIHVDNLIKEFSGGPVQLKRRYVPYRELLISLAEPDPTPLPELPRR